MSDACDFFLQLKNFIAAIRVSSPNPHSPSQLRSAWKLIEYASLLYSDILTDTRHFFSTRNAKQEKKKEQNGGEVDAHDENLPFEALDIKTQWVYNIVVQHNN